MKGLRIFNFIGVLVLVALCVAQWRKNLDLNLEINRHEKLRLEQAAHIAEQQKAIRDLEEDLERFKEHYSRAQNDLNQARQALRASEQKVLQITSERDQLKTSVTNWTAAVQVRDDRLKEANARITQLADELNASVGKFNQLATNYNALVKDLNAFRGRPAQPPSTR